MSDHWIGFWRDHASATRGEDDQTQVLRTVAKKPIDGERFGEIVADLTSRLALSGQERVLDLCCGNGLVACHLAPRCGSVLGVDFCPEFVHKINARDVGNLSAQVGDITEVRFENGSFDRVLLYAALQYLDLGEALRLLESIHGWLRPGGLLFLGDVPDAGKIWSFFDSEERQRAHFQGVLAGEPIIGTWFDSGWLRNAGIASGYEGIEILEQPSASPNAHYRFDMLLRRGGSGVA